MDTETLTPEQKTVFARLYKEQAFYEGASSRFFDAWRHAVSLAGYRYFGDGTIAGWESAKDKWTLVPNTELIKNALGVCSHGEKVFLAALYCFYNDIDGKDMCAAAGLNTVLDLTILDMEHKLVISDLLFNYNGW